MKTLEQLHREAMDSLMTSKQMMLHISAVCPDWAANHMLRMDYESLESALADYGRYQLGLRGVREKRNKDI